MDEHSFDDFMKRKMENYEDPFFDERALSDLHRRVSSFQPKPWYRQYRTELTVLSSLILFTILNAYIMTPVKSHQEAEPVSFTLVSYKHTIDSLEKVIVTLSQNPQNSRGLSDKLPPDTSRDVGRKNETSTPVSYSASEDFNNQDVLLLGPSYSLPMSLINALREHHFITRKGETTYWRKGISYDTVLLQNPFTLMANIQTPDFHTRAVNRDALTLHDIHGKNGSAKTQNSLEKHYFRGLGIRVSPHADVVVNAFESSKSALTPRLGANVDWVISPRWSVETSLDYLTTRFTLRNSYEKYDISTHHDERWGSPINVTVTSQNISVPLSIKYRQWVSAKNEIVTRATFTPYYAMHQKFVMNYAGAQVYGDDGSSISKTETKDVGKFYGSTWGISAGLQHAINPRNKTEFSLFYEKSLGAVGPQKNQMQLFGLRGAYWFTLR